MAAFQVENGTATGRGFDSAGFVGKLETFMTTPISAGGGGWFLHDTSVSAGYGYKVFTDVENPPLQSVYKCFSAHITSTGTQVDFYFHLGWDNTNHISTYTYGYHPLDTADSTDFLYSFRAGPEALMISTRVASTWYFTGMDTFYGISGLLDDNSVSGTTVSANYSETAGQQIAGISFATNYENAIDVSANTYLRIRPTASTNVSAIEVYPNSTYTSMVASATFTRLATTATKTNITLGATNGSGVTGYVYLTGPTSASDIRFNIGQLQLNSGQGLRFTAGDYYFAVYQNGSEQGNSYNYNTGSLQNLYPSVNFFKVLSISGDTLNIDYGNSKGLYKNFGTTTMVGAYLHRFVAFGHSSKINRNMKMWIPYYSYTSDIYKYVNGGGTNYREIIHSGIAGLTNPYYPFPGIQLSWEENFLERTCPDYRGNYSIQEPGIADHVGPENYTSFSPNITGKRLYGPLRNIKVTMRNDLVIMSTGMTLDGINYLYFAIQSDLGYNMTAAYFLIRDSESLT